MSTFIKLYAKINDVINCVYEREHEAEKNRLSEYNAAVKLQAWFKGVQCRAHLTHLNGCATTIQKHWRAHGGRKRSKKQLETAIDLMTMKHYNGKALQIQKVWKGFYVRKYVANYYARKQYLKSLEMKNEIVRQELQNVAEIIEERKRIEKEKANMKNLKDYAKKNHYLLSTEVQSGIYNSPYRMYPDIMEYYLREVKPLINRNKKTNLGHLSYSSQEIPANSHLPPLQTKQKGPFKDPMIVKCQRYKSFDPSLRVETDYFSVEKARDLMNASKWILFSDDWRYCNPSPPTTEASLHADSTFRPHGYGKDYFKKENPDKWMTKDSFKCVVPPIPVFDKFGATYSQGQV